MGEEDEGGENEPWDARQEKPVQVVCPTVDLNRQQSLGEPDRLVSLDSPGQIIPEDADKAWSGEDIWGHFCRAAASDNVVGEDLLELSFSNVYELAKSYGFQSPLMKVKLEMEFIRLQKRCKKQLERA